MVFLNADGMIPQLLNYVVDAKTQEERLFYLFHMRHISEGWTNAHRKAYFAWLKRMNKAQSDIHFLGFMKHIISGALAKVPLVDRGEYERIFGDKKISINMPNIDRPDHKVWTLADFANSFGDFINHYFSFRQIHTAHSRKH